MERRKFIKTCCYTAVAIPLLGIALQSCDTLYYANATVEKNQLIIPKSEFVTVNNDKPKNRKFVLVKTEKFDFPICIYKMNDVEYNSALLKCTHTGCELNVGGGIYTCPCHGSEFSTMGNVLEGPADGNLKMFKTEIKNENIYVYLS